MPRRQTIATEERRTAATKKERDAWYDNWSLGEPERAVDRKIGGSVTRRLNEAWEMMGGYDA